MLALAFALTLIASAQEADRIERLRELPKAGTVWYTYRVQGKTRGYLRVRASRALHEGKEALQIDFDLSLRLARPLIHLQTTTLSRLDAWLTPIRIESESYGQGKTQSRKAEFADGKVRIGEKEKDVPVHLITSEAEMLLVAAMTLKPGTKIEYASWETEDMRAKTGHVLEVVAEEEIEIEGNTLKCAKISHSGKGCREHYYWVDSDRRVVRMLFDARIEIILTTKPRPRDEK